MSISNKKTEYEKAAFKRRLFVYLPAFSPQWDARRKISGKASRSKKVWSLPQMTFETVGIPFENNILSENLCPEYGTVVSKAP